MQKAIQCNGWECCMHCRLDLSDLEDVLRSHYKKDGDEQVCEYKGVMTALIATVIKDRDPRIQRMVQRWIGKGAMDIAKIETFEGRLAQLGHQNKRAINAQLGQQTQWYRLRVPIMVKVFMYVVDLKP